MPKKKSNNTSKQDFDFTPAKSWQDLTNRRLTAIEQKIGQMDKLIAGLSKDLRKARELNQTLLDNINRLHDERY